jgi:hypothetical protein
VLDQLRRAEQLDPGLEGTDGVRADLFFEKWDEARRAGDREGSLLYRDLVRRFDPGGGLASRFSPTGTLHVSSTPTGAECHLFRFRELREIEEGGAPRAVPVAIGGGHPPVAPGTWVLRVVAGAGDVVPGDLLLEVAGHPVKGAMFGIVDGEPRRIQSVGGKPIAGPTDLDQALGAEGDRTVRFEGGATAPAVTGLTPAALAARGGVSAWVYHLGETRRETLPPGLVLRTTAAPAFLSPASRIGRTPVTREDLPAGDYLVVLRAPGREELREMVHLPEDRNIALEMLPAGSTPPGFIHVAADGRGPAFWMMEREVTAGEYMRFLDDPEVRARATERALTPRSLDEVYWKRGADGRFLLPADWRPDQPVVGVSWYDARAYVAWAAKRDGRHYALPTQSEWERAAGTAGLGRFYPFGDVFRPKWVSSNWSRPRAYVEPVMRYPVDESPLGMYDAAGSAMEWLDALYAGKKTSRWLAGGAWGQSDPALFRVPGGWGASPDAVSGLYGFRMVWRP